MKRIGVSITGFAALVLAFAKRLQVAEYDLDEVTPDADNWTCGPIF